MLCQKDARSLELWNDTADAEEGEEDEEEDLQNLQKLEKEMMLIVKQNSPRFFHPLRHRRFRHYCNNT